LINDITPNINYELKLVQYNYNTIKNVIKIFKMLFLYFVFYSGLASLIDAKPQVLPTLGHGLSRISGNLVIDCRRPTAAYFPDPEDCRNFYHCSDWTGLQKKSCGNSLYFNPQTQVCDWPNHVRAIRPECPSLESLTHQEKAPKAFQSIDNIQDVAALRFVPLSTNPIRFPDPTPSEPLSQFTLEHAIPGSTLFKPLGQVSSPIPVREEVRSISGNRNKGRVITPAPIQVTPLPPLNEIDELHAPKHNGQKSTKPSRRPINTNPAIINTIQNDFVITTPFPQIKHVIPQQQALRINRPFNLQHPFQTNFDQVRITPNSISQNIPISQRPIQRTTTSSPAPSSTTTTTTTTPEPQTSETTTPTPQVKTTSSGEEKRKQRFRIRNKTRKTTTTPSPIFQTNFRPTTTPSPIFQTNFRPTRPTAQVKENPKSTLPTIRTRQRGRLIATRVRRPINGKKSRKPQILSNRPQKEEQFVDENKKEVRIVVDRRPVPLPKVRGTVRPTQRVVENEEIEEQSEIVSNFRLKQRQRVKSEKAFLICSDGKCSRPKAGDNSFLVNDLKTSASARLPADNTFNRLFEEMLVESGIDTEDAEQKGQVLSLLEAAKVQFEEDPETNEFVLGELLETTIAPVEESATEAEEETTTKQRFNNPRRRPFLRPSIRRPFLKSKSQEEFKKEELEEELKFEEELEEEAETIINESEIVDQEMLDEMENIKENIKRIKEQIEALRNLNKSVGSINLDDATEVSVQTVSFVEGDDQNTSTEKELTFEHFTSTSKSSDDTTIASTEEPIDSTAVEEVQDVITKEEQPNIETTSNTIQAFNAVQITTVIPNTEEENRGQAGIEVGSFLQDFEPIFDYQEGSGEEAVFVVRPVQISDNENNVVLEEESSKVRVIETTTSQKALPVVTVTDSAKQMTTSEEEIEVPTTTAPAAAPTEPSSYDLLVNLMDHFNLNAIINSLSEDTLDKQIKVTKLDDDSDELLQESVVLPTQLKDDTIIVVEATTAKVQPTTVNIQTTTEDEIGEEEILEIGSFLQDFEEIIPHQDRASIIPSAPETTLETESELKEPEEMIHIVMPAGWSTTSKNDEVTTIEEVSRTTTIEPTVQQANTINPVIVDVTTEAKTGTIKDGFVVATNKPFIRFPTKKATVVEKKIRLNRIQLTTTERPRLRLRTSTTTTASTTTTPTTTTTAATTTTLLETTALPEKEVITTEAAEIVIDTEVVTSQSVDEQETVEKQDTTTTPVVEAPRSSIGRKVVAVAINDIEDKVEPKEEAVVIVASSGSEIEAGATKIKDKKVTDSIEEESIEEDEPVTSTPLTPTPSSKVRKLNRFSSNRDRIRKRLRQNIKGVKTVNALSIVRDQQKSLRKKATKNAFLLRGNGNGFIETKPIKKKKIEKEDRKKAQSRRKELFRKRVTRPRTRLTKLSSATRSPTASTTTNSDSVRTSSRFIPPGKATSNTRFAPTGSRSRDILSRGKPQATRGLFVNQRPSTPESINPTASVSSKIASSTTNVAELQKLQRQLKQEELKLRTAQESPNQNDEGGGREDFFKKKESSTEAVKGDAPNIRCRFFRNSC